MFDVSEELMEKISKTAKNNDFLMGKNTNRIIRNITCATCQGTCKGTCRGSCAASSVHTQKPKKGR